MRKKRSSGLGMVELMITIAIAGAALIPLIGVIVDISSENTLSKEELAAVHDADTIMQFIFSLSPEYIKPGIYYMGPGVSLDRVLHGPYYEADFQDYLKQAAEKSKFTMTCEIRKINSKLSKKVINTGSLALNTVKVTIDPKDNSFLKKKVSLKGIVRSLKL